MTIVKSENGNRTCELSEEYIKDMLETYGIDMVKLLGVMLNIKSETELGKGKHCVSMRFRVDEESQEPSFIFTLHNLFDPFDFKVNEK